jgi:hypothetical protein
MIHGHPFALQRSGHAAVAVGGHLQSQALNPVSQDKVRRAPRQDALGAIQRTATHAQELTHARQRQRAVPAGFPRGLTGRSPSFLVFEPAQDFFKKAFSTVSCPMRRSSSATFASSL